MKRIVVCGPVLAGKTTLLEAIAVANGAAVESVTVQSIDDQLLTCRGARVKLRKKSLIDITTLCGPTQDRGVWRTLLSGSAAVVLVLDGQRERAEANGAWIAQLHQDTSLIVDLVVVTKLDLPNAALTTTIPLLAGTRLTSCAIAPTRTGDAQGAMRAVDAFIASV